MYSLLLLIFFLMSREISCAIVWLLNDFLIAKSFTWNDRFPSKGCVIECKWSKMLHTEFEKCCQLLFWQHWMMLHNRIHFSLEMGGNKEIELEIAPLDQSIIRAYYTPYRLNHKQAKIWNSSKIEAAMNGNDTRLVYWFDINHKFANNVSIYSLHWWKEF